VTNASKKLRIVPQTFTLEINPQLFLVLYSPLNCWRRIYMDVRLACGTAGGMYSTSTPWSFARESTI
jgi:hypothetical protein